MLWSTVVLAAVALAGKCNANKFFSSSDKPQYIYNIVFSFRAASAPQHTEIELTNDGVNETGPFVMGGNLAVSGAFPSIVSIQTPAAPLNHCNGVIINPTHILTSCRCVFNAQNQLINPFFMRVIAGDLNIMTPSYRRISASVTRIYPHPQFDPQTGNNDIAVLRVCITNVKSKHPGDDNCWPELHSAIFAPKMSILSIKLH